MNRERLETETLEQYHAMMQAEQAEIDQHLKGRMVHVSKEYTPLPDPERMGATKFVPSPGNTYVKPLGERDE